MFLDKTIQRNRRLIDVTIDLHQKGILEPDTYVIDVDQVIENAKLILDKAKEIGISLYFMTKQLGRNPYIAKKLIEIGYQSAVVVDFKEAQVMMKHNIPLGNVGHLVQIPKHQLKKIIEYKTEVITVFTIDKLKEINEVCKELDIKQNVILKVYSNNDIIYPGQDGGVHIDKLEEFILEASELDHIKVIGVTVFPAFLFNVQEELLEQTNNYQTGMKAVEILKQKGLDITHINMPSTTCIHTLKMMENSPVTHGEPGHGFSGTTPIHAHLDLEETPSVIYLSEISHNTNNQSYCYGGGHYRRSHVSKALVHNGETEKIVNVLKFKPDNIDYYLQLDEKCDVSSSVIMAFRFQIFVTRSNVALLEHIHCENPKIVGIYDALGKRVDGNE